MEVIFEEDSYYVIETDNTYNPTIIYRNIRDLKEAISLSREIKNQFPTFTYTIFKVEPLFVF